MQRKILVPTDFSKTAIAAGDMAIELAPLFNAQVHFFHKVNLPPKWEEYDESQKSEFPDAEKRLRAMRANFAQLERRYEDRHVKVVSTYSAGDMVPTISQYIEDQDIYMIVMGSQGAKGLKGWAFGSNAQRLVRYAHCPVLVVKKPDPKPNFKQLVFASDFKPEARKPFEELIEFGKRFGAFIHLLHIAAYPRFEVTEKDVARMEAFAKDCPLPYKIHGVGDFEITGGIQYFARKTNADLLGIAHSGRSSLQRLITGSVSEAIVNLVEFPVLVLNTREDREEMQSAPGADPATASHLWTVASSKE